MSSTQQSARTTTVNAEAEILADHIVDKLVTRMSDEDTVKQITDVWARQLDQHIGRTVRRGLVILLTALVVIVGIKFDALISWFRN
jgi:uncharacterized lipoprotein YmbA